MYTDHEVELTADKKRNLVEENGDNQKLTISRTREYN